LVRFVSNRLPSNPKDVVVDSELQKKGVSIAKSCRQAYVHNCPGEVRPNDRMASNVGICKYMGNRLEGSVQSSFLSSSCASLEERFDEVQKTIEKLLELENSLRSSAAPSRYHLNRCAAADGNPSPSQSGADTVVDISPTYDSSSRQTFGSNMDWGVLEALDGDDYETGLFVERSKPVRHSCSVVGSDSGTATPHFGEGSKWQALQ